MSGSGKRIRVFILPTITFDMYSSGCNLMSVVALLNESQKVERVFDFIFVPAVRAAGNKTFMQPFEITQRKPLPNDRHTSTEDLHPDTVTQMMGRYISDLDAFAQAEFYMSQALEGTSQPLSYDDLVVVIDSNVFIPEDKETKIFCDPAEDCYSCLANVMTLRDEDNNHPKPFHSVCLISMLRLPIVFPDLWTPLGRDFARAKTARYIIANIAHFLAGRLFSHSLAREHLSLCVAESSWTGNEAVSYAATGLCNECKVLSRKLGPATMFSMLSTESLQRALDDVTGVSDMIDSLFLMKMRSMSRAGLIFNVLVASLFTNLLAGFAIGEDAVVWSMPHYLVPQHWPATVVLVTGLITLAGLTVRWVVHRARLP